METPMIASYLDAEAGERGGIIILRKKTPARPLPFMVVLQKKHPRPSHAPCSGRSRRAQNRRPSPDSRGFYIYTIITVALYTNITLIMRLTDVTAFSWISYIFTTLSYVA
jgi:hypothetical protein